MTVRIGAVSYLNTKPLIYGLSERLPGSELHLDLPSRLADQLSSDQLDVALIPSVEFLRSAQHTIVSDACIACRGAVRSVRVLFRKPPERVRTLALDEGSRTSAVLAQVLLARRFGLRPQLLPFHIGASLESVDADAVLMIGDRAMHIDSSQLSGTSDRRSDQRPSSSQLSGTPDRRHAFVDDWDLGQAWTELTGLPFVFAMWVAVDRQLDPHVTDALEESRDAGLANIDNIIAGQAAHYGLTSHDCRTYFLEQLHFQLGPRELQGLDLFRQWAVELQLLPAASHQLSLAPL